MNISEMSKTELNEYRSRLISEISQLDTKQGAVKVL